MEKHFETLRTDEESVRILAAQLAETPADFSQEMRGVTYTRPFGPLEWGDAHQ